MEIKFLDSEVWYPATSEYGKDMPYDKSTLKEVKFCNNPTANQMNTFLFSSKGRVIFNEEGFIAKFESGKIKLDRDIVYIETFLNEALNIELFGKEEFDNKKSDILRENNRGNLKTAFSFISKKIFSKSEKFLSEKFLELPIYNTWMYMPYKVDENIVINYANSILDAGLEKGIIIIDDKWNKSYGDWKFDESKFPNPKAMIDKLHNMGFLVMLWVCPYIDFDSDTYEFFKQKNYLLKSGEDIYSLEWWNGNSACFDLRKVEVIKYLKETFKDLQDLGIDGFKFDGGDSRFYISEHEPDLQSYEWAKLASEYELNELRADFNTYLLPIFERLSDKKHTWKEEGIASIIPSALALGLSGHQIYAPDMIGGGEVKDIVEKLKLKEDIFMSHVQMALLMPNMQFSILPKRVLGENYHKFLELLKLRREYLEYILSLYEKTKKDKVPLLRLLEYEFPNQNYEYEKLKFMLGDKYLVIPVSNEEMLVRGIDFKLPEGKWKFKDKVYSNREEVHIDFDLYDLVIFEKIS